MQPQKPAFGKIGLVSQFSRFSSRFCPIRLNAACVRRQRANRFLCGIQDGSEVLRKDEGDAEISASATQECAAASAEADARKTDSSEAEAPSREQRSRTQGEVADLGS